jgi:hypothetical protein
MAEKETVFSSEVKYNGIFSFKDFYKFCYDWLTEEVGLDVSENIYEEKLSGDSKDIKIEWAGESKLTDYFRFDAKVDIVVRNLTGVEINQGGRKVKTNKGDVKVKIKGILVRDYEGKFEATAFNKFLRSIYEKWVITSRVSQFEDKIVGSCDDFLGQTKAYLDLEGKR